MTFKEAVSAADWGKGIGLSVLASLIGCASKLAIRKSWLIEETFPENRHSSSSSLSSSSARDPLVQNCGDGGSSEEDTMTTGINDSGVTDEDSSSLHHHQHHPSTQQQDHHRQQYYYYKRQKLIAYGLRGCGMIGMSILNPICCVWAMNYASPSILAPFSGLTLVWVIVFSFPILGELPSTTQILAASLIGIGEVIVALFGDHTNEDDATIEQVRNSYLAPAFIGYFVALFAYVLLLWYFINYSNHPILRKFAWGTCGGSLTGMQNFLKDTLTIAKATTATAEPHYPWFFYLFMILAGASAFCGLLVLTACMKRYDATYSSATFVGSFVVSASIMSAVHYNTFQMLQGLWNYILYPLGLIILMVGVLLLVRDEDKRVIRNHHHHDHHHGVMNEDPFHEGDDRASEQSELTKKMIQHHTPPPPPPNNNRNSLSFELDTEESMTLLPKFRRRSPKKALYGAWTGR